MLQREEATQERLLRPGEQGHIDGALPAAQHCAQGHDQQLVEVVSAGVTCAWVLLACKAGEKLVRGALPRFDAGTR